MSTATTTKVKGKSVLNVDRRSTLSEPRKISNVSFSSKPKSFGDKPTPVDFDSFLPWVCKEMSVPHSIMVLPMAQDKLSRTSAGSGKSRAFHQGRGQKYNIKIQEDQTSTTKKLSDISTISTKETKPVNQGDCITVTAYYDTLGHLVEIAIIDSNLQIPKQVIQAISFCFPFHAYFTKLRICKGGVYCSLLYEIGKILPYSHITDICLDDSFVPEGNYYVLLERLSHLKHLSMSRCSISDDVCEKIFSRLKYGSPAEKSVMMVNLSSNHLTDVGAKTIGEVLRQNRHLLHLNLAGNAITDEGFDFILKTLAEFPLTYDEVLETKRYYVEYCKNKIDVYDKCLEEIVESHKLAVAARRSTRAERMKERKKGLLKELTEDEYAVQAEKNTVSIVGEFHHPFDNTNTVKRDNYLHSLGNLRLCSLNISYNKIEFTSLMKIIKVLTYQKELDKKPPNTGLMRIVLEGNFLPNLCPELDIIRHYLKKAVKCQEPALVNSPRRKARTAERRDGRLKSQTNLDR